MRYILTRHKDNRHCRGTDHNRIDEHTKHLHVTL
ncbi:Uncharacterised protein [Vibrio cholerae]|nr:Uncharacterised protein [Vibrio cholerae]CSI11665.1 Uncharacterised protein [Vibrio cholerae]CSI66443.1 Uncharacterised protein [Vibrio cholerae]